MVVVVNRAVVYIYRYMYMYIYMVHIYIHDVSIPYTTDCEHDVSLPRRPRGTPIRHLLVLWASLPARGPRTWRS